MMSHNCTYTVNNLFVMLEFWNTFIGLNNMQTLDRKYSFEQLEDLTLT
jgi:hypothetical protein